MQVSTRIETGYTLLHLSTHAVHTRKQGHASRMRARNSQLRLATEGNRVMQLHPLPYPFCLNVDHRGLTSLTNPYLPNNTGNRTLSTPTEVCHEY